MLELINDVEKVDNTLFEKALEIQDYAVEIRYPDSIIELTDEDINSAIEIARDFRVWILKKLDLEIEFDDFNIGPVPCE